jgi:signal transduction histidine kinase/CheY-like chemotaxis protein
MHARWRDNLQELRRDLVGSLALPYIVGGALAGALAIPLQAFPNPRFLLAFACLGLGLIAFGLQLRWPRLAGHALAWGGCGLLALAMWTLPEPWIPFVGIPMALVAAALIPGGGWIVALAVSGLTAWLAATGARAYQPAVVAALLILAAAVGGLALRSLRVALVTAWETEQKSDEMLVEARAYQGRLASVLHSLELTTHALEQANHNLGAARRQAEEAQRMKEQFAANISHELRTPLNLILGFSDMMYLSPEVYGEMAWPPTLRRDVYQVYRSSRHLLEMIDDILDLSRFELAGFTLNKEPTDLAELLESAVEIAAGLFRGRSVQLSWSVEPGLPLLDVDRTRIRQVALNLLTNARHHTESGSVRLEARREGGEVIVSVRDTGSGIPADKLGRIFDEFYRVDESLRRKTGGAGLGLAISKHFVQAHEGRIWVESEVGQGSVFHFALPVPEGGLRTAYPRHTPSLEGARRPGKPRVAVLDPDPAVGALVRRYLDGCDVVQVSRAADIAAGIDAAPLAAVIRNVRPGGGDDGLDDLPDVPVIECSLPSANWLAGDLAVSAVLHKPITAEQLLAEIDRAGPAGDILIVDDDRGFCQLVERMLAASGRTFAVRRAYDGEEGLAAMRERAPDLALLDLAMPRMDGFQLIERMRQEPGLAQVKVVLLTVTSYAEDLLSREGSAVTVTRAGGLRLAEVLACLQGVAGALSHPAPDPAQAAGSQQTQPAQGVEDRVAADRFGQEQGGAE